MSPMTCTECSGLFAFLPRGLCVDCQEAREERFQAVRDWLVTHPTATMVDLTAALEIDEALVTRWIREGRLHAVEPSPDALERERVEQQMRARFARQAAGLMGSQDQPRMRSKPS